jgi:hypothetical protein
MKWIPSERLKCKESKVRSRGRMLARSAHRRGPKAESGSTSRPGRGCPTDPWLVGPRRTMLYRGGGGHCSRYEVICTATNPTYNPSDRRSTGAVGSTTIAAANVLLHHPCTVPPTASTPLPQHHVEPALSLPPLRQVEEAHATSTEEMANPSAAPSSLVDGRCPPTPFLSVVLCLCVVVMS